MKWVRKLIAYLSAPRVAKPVEQHSPLIAESKKLRNDIRELRRFEIIVRKR